MSSNMEAYPRIGVGIVILKGKKVLLGKRKGPRKPGKYGLPGGFLENGESFTECAKRELREETGLLNTILQPIYIIRGLDGDIDYTDIIFFTQHNTGIPVVKEENRVEKWEWFNIFNLPTPLYVPTKIALDQFASNLNYHKLVSKKNLLFPPKKIKVQYIDILNYRK